MTQQALPFLNVGWLVVLPFPRCGVVGSTLTFGSIGHGFEFRAPLIFTLWCISLQQAEITDEVLTGRFSSSTAVDAIVQDKLRLI